jgi:hypothetical protein
MSDERRRRQQEREKQAQSLPIKKIAIIAVIVVVIGSVGFTAKYKHDHRYDGFARCVASKNVKMYGLYWCEHCAEQKEMFGAAFKYVPYIECGIKGQRGELPTCKDAGVKLFPTWQFADERHEGTLSLDTISDKTGCSLP